MNLLTSSNQTPTVFQDENLPQIDRLPRLLYIADTPVEQSCHGSTLVYRLLSQYPADRLRIVEVGEMSQPSRRLFDRDYHHCPLPSLLQRALNTRFRRWAEVILSRAATLALSTVDTCAASFEPEAVLTVMHGFGWMKAHRLAEARNLPLHCIVHDDWPSMYGGRGDSYVRRRFEESYVTARSRLCVSAAMVEEYKNRYGCAGEVLLPCRSPGVTGSIPKGIRKNKAGPITMAFAGSINGKGYAHALRHVADCLAEQDGKLLIYGPLTETAAANAGLQMPNIKICGMIAPARLVETLQREADLLFVPMSFDQIDRTNMTIAFPSKLTDYTLTGLPLLIYGPEYCSAVRFARENHGLAEVVATTDPTEMKQTLRRLTDPVQRASLGESSITLGNRLFSLESALKIFYAGL